MNNINTQATLIVIADDLTGAADCAARGHNAGLSAEINVDPTQEQGTPDTGLLALNTDSRHADPSDAQHSVMNALSALRPANHKSIIYNKIDSTLRGNIGVEIDGILNNVNIDEEQSTMLVCPAFPQQGRGLENGRLVRRRVAAADTTHESAYTTTETGPNLVGLLQEQSTLPVGRIELRQVRAGVRPLVAALSTAARQGARSIVADGMTDADLATIVDAALQIPGMLLCGSAGMVTPLAKRMADTKRAALHEDSAIENQATHGTIARQLATTDASARPTLAPDAATWIVVGSGSRTAHTQIETARAAGIPCYDALHATPDWNASALILHLPTPTPDTPLEGDTARAFVAQLRASVAAGLQQTTPATLVLVGGDTAQIVLPELEMTRLRVLAEVQPGMPLVCNARQPEQRPRIILKAGNHGGSDALLELLAWLRQAG